MNRISTSAAYQSALLNIMNAQNRQAEAQRQVATGMKANDLKGFGHQATALTAANSLNARIETHLENAKSAASTLSIQDQALGEVAAATQSAREAVANALATGSAIGLSEALEGSLDRISGALNTRFEGRYLFAGGQAQTPPVAAGALSDLVAAPSVASLFANDRLQVAARVDDGVVLQTGFLADDVGLQSLQALQGVAALNAGPNGPLSGSLTPAQTAQLQALLGSFDAAYSTVNDQVARNGGMQNRVDDMIASLDDRQTGMKGIIADIAEVDGAEAASRLKLSQIALEASAQVFATLNTSSLLNVLRQ